MQSLFIANASKQEFILTYMLPESVRSTMHKISSGRQIKLDLSGVDVDAIIKQQAPYGLMATGTFCPQLRSSTSMFFRTNSTTEGR